MGLGLHLILKNCTFGGNGGSNGGAIYNDGELLSSNDLFSTDSIGIQNGAILGGSIYNTGYVSSSGDSFSHELASYGGAVYNLGTMDVSGDSFSENGHFPVSAGSGTTVSNGGAIWSSGWLKVSRTSFVNNTALYHGGGIYYTGTLIVDGTDSWSGNTPENIYHA